MVLRGSKALVVGDAVPRREGPLFLSSPPADPHGASVTEEPTQPGTTWWAWRDCEKRCRLQAGDQVTCHTLYGGTVTINVSLT